MSDDAQASCHGLLLQNVTYDSQMSRTAGSTCRSSSISSRGTPSAMPSRIQSSMPPVPGSVPSWSMIRPIHSRRTSASGQFDRIAASFRGTTR